MALFDRILVFGTEGQVSQALKEYCPSARFIARSECDFLRTSEISGVLDQYDPTLVINPAAYTEVDRAESEFEVALRINADAPAAIAHWCRQRRASLIHFSTDYVYPGDGEAPWSENDRVCPRNKYGETKLEGERAIVRSECHYTILRTSWIFSEVGKNFVKTMMRLGQERESLSIVADQIGSPTYAGDLAKTVVQIIEHERFSIESGVFNVCNSGFVSWFEFAQGIFSEMRERGMLVKVKSVDPISSFSYPTPASRPLNSRLNTGKLKREFGIQLRPWQEALRECFENLA